MANESERIAVVEVAKGFKVPSRLNEISTVLSSVDGLKICNGLGEKEQEEAIEEGRLAAVVVLIPEDENLAPSERKRLLGVLHCLLVSSRDSTTVVVCEMSMLPVLLAGSSRLSSEQRAALRARAVAFLRRSYGGISSIQRVPLHSAALAFVGEDLAPLALAIGALSVPDEASLLAGVLEENGVRTILFGESAGADGLLRWHDAGFKCVRLEKLEPNSSCIPDLAKPLTLSNKRFVVAFSDGNSVDPVFGEMPRAALTNFALDHLRPTLVPTLLIGLVDMTAWGPVVMLPSESSDVLQKLQLLFEERGHDLLLSLLRDFQPPEEPWCDEMNEEREIRLGILGSTRGTDLQYLLEAKAKGWLNASIEVVVSNRKDAGILERAARYGIPTVRHGSKGLSTRAEFDALVTKTLQEYNVDLVLLIGYMRILSDEFVETWENKVLNVHPSLLPEFAGGMDLNVHQEVLNANRRETGCTIHIVTSEVDGGPIVVQKRCKVLPSDDADSLKGRVQALEGPAFVEAIYKIRISSFDC